MTIKEFFRKNRHFSWQNASAVKSLKPVHFTITDRFNSLRAISKFAKNGKIGIIWEGMDCDCTAFSYASVYSTNVVSINNTIDKKYEEAEGPLNYRFCDPEYAKTYKSASRDLALEAFENGHAHVVYY